MTSGTGTRYYLAAAGALVLATVAALLLIIAPHDPMPPVQSGVVAAAGPIGTTLVLCVVPTPLANPLQTWPIGAGAAAASFLCVRGRTSWAWIGSLLTLAAAVAWSLLTEQGVGPGLGVSLTSLGPLLMASFFAYTIRPTAEEVFTLRAQATSRIAEEAASAAALEERRIRSEHLTQFVTPILQRIVDGPPLNRAEATTARLLEAELRDRLRAPQLAVPDILDSARAARKRGVTVVLLDDHGLDEAPQEVLNQLRTEANRSLSSAQAGGFITIRIHPPDRVHIASILVRDADGITIRADYDSDAL